MTTNIDDIVQDLYSEIEWLKGEIADLKEPMEVKVSSLNESRWIKIQVSETDRSLVQIIVGGDGIPDRIVASTDTD